MFLWTTSCEVCFFFILIFDAKSIKLIYKPKNEYKKEKGDYTKTFSKGVKSEIRQSQLIPSVLSPNEIRDSIRPK